MHQINVVNFDPSSKTQISIFSQTIDFSGEDIDTVINPNTDSYDLIPRSEQVKTLDARLLKVFKWLQDLTRPDDLSDSEYATFIRYCTEFFIDDNRLWRKHPQGVHKLVISPDHQLNIIRIAHDSLGHKAYFATKAHIDQQFWWPSMASDIHWYTKTCHICQLRQTRQVLIPPIVATPAPIFAKAYIDTMHMPPSGSSKYIVQARCSLSYYPEFKMLRTKTSKTLGDWIYKDILCQWGSLHEIVTDNGPAFLKAMDYLSRRYHLNHIQISGYNSRANGIVERSHFDVRQSLFKAVDGDQKRWSLGAFSVFWAE
jgi:hypothetical protein